MKAKVKPIPDGFHTLTPYLMVKGAARAIDFYRRAFGATERFRMNGPDGKTVGHAEITTFKERVETFGQSEIVDNTLLIPYSVSRYFMEVPNVKLLYFSNGRSIGW